MSGKTVTFQNVPINSLFKMSEGGWLTYQKLSETTFTGISSTSGAPKNVPGENLSKNVYLLEDV